ncbi:heterokaryon incompatibility protein-domain-containing protein [Apiospora rasikravindrae]|uniref:Heterokaryon incompatibility protein-domain-containing protein n=1 Tax=Apiospora rasikravindrae TaxID=990691 RepID=A0ABR1TYE4_9PEZI
MASDWGYDLPEPDYGRPVEDVFQEFVVAFLHLHGNLLPLTTTLPAGPSTGLPSWVPDWLTSRPVVSEEDVDVSGVFASLYPPDWSATKSSYSYVTWDRNRKSLELRGKRIGSIRSRISGSPKEQYDDPASEAFDDFIKACQKWIQSLSVSAIDQSMQIPQDTNDTSRPKWSAMEQFVLFTPWGPARSRQLGPIFPTQDEHSWEFSWDRVARHKILLDWLHRTRYPSLDEAVAALGDSPFVDVLSDSQKLDNNPHGEVPQYLQHVSRSPALLEANFRTMQRHVNLFANYAFLTIDGGLWARAHLSCQVGDEVWLLAGSDVPVVLRRQRDDNTRFRVVGPAYVDGAMYGKMWADDESMLETITLV